jgi:uncharacterized protein
MRKWMMGAGAVLLLGLGTGPALAAAPTEAQVQQLMEVFNAGKMFDQMNAQMAEMMGQQLPCVPASYWQNYINADGVKQLTERVVPIYQRHFTAEDVAELLKFYRSPLGQKVIAQMPQVMSEASLANQQWGRQRAQEMLGQLQKEGKLDTQGRCPAAPATGSSTLKGK